MSFKRFFLLALCSITFFANSQNEGEDYVNDNALRYDDATYKATIKTVQLHGTQWEYSPPLIA